MPPKNISGAAMPRLGESPVQRLQPREEDGQTVNSAMRNWATLGRAALEVRDPSSTLSMRWISRMLSRTSHRIRHEGVHPPVSRTRL